MRRASERPYHKCIQNDMNTRHFDTRHKHTPERENNAVTEQRCNQTDGTPLAGLEARLANTSRRGRATIIRQELLAAATRQGQERIETMHAIEQLVTAPTLMASAREEIVKGLGEMYAGDHGLLGNIVAILTRCMAMYPATTGKRLLKRCKGVICKMIATEPARMQVHMATAANRVIAAQPQLHNTIKASLTKWANAEHKGGNIDTHE